MSKPEVVWAVVDSEADTLVLWDGRAPMYWRRHVAVEAARAHGHETKGRYADVRIRRVEIRLLAPRKRT